MRLSGPVRSALLDAVRRVEVRAVRRIPRPRDPALQRMVGAVEAAVRGRATPEERAWFRRIEALRRRLLASDGRLALPDYGPGTTSVSDREAWSGYHAAPTVAEQCAGSKSPFGARLLFRLVRELRPARCLELGTNLGISAAYQAAALRLNGAGALTTVEGAPELARRAREHLAGLGLDAEVLQGRFGDVLPAVLARPDPLDYVFIDGHHDGPATVAYFDRIHPALARGALVVFDDVAWSSGMARAWEELRADPRIRVSVGLGAMGLAWVDGAAAPRVRADVPLHI